MAAVALGAGVQVVEDSGVAEVVSEVVAVLGGGKSVVDFLNLYGYIPYEF